MERQRWQGLLVSVGLTLLFVAIGQLAQFALDPLAQWAGLTDRVDLPDTFIVALLWVGFLMPAIEEVMFRAGLRRITFNLFVLPALVIGISANSKEGVLLAVPIGLFAFIAGLVFMLKNHRNPVYTRHICRSFSRNFPWYFWSNAVLFGLLHANHFVLNDLRSLAVLILLLPYVAMGALFGYLRLRYGLLASITAHALNNTLGVIFVFALGTA